MIQSVRTYFHGEVTAVSFAEAQLRVTQAQIARRLRMGEPLPLLLTARLDVRLSHFMSESPALAYVNGGNWLWRCECGGCEFVDLELQIGMCCSCWNEALGYCFRPILVPDEREEIERLLLARPDAATRNWHSGESPEDLRAENLTHGVHGVADG